MAPPVGQQFFFVATVDSVNANFNQPEEILKSAMQP